MCICILADESPVQASVTPTTVVATTTARPSQFIYLLPQPYEGGGLGSYLQLNQQSLMSSPMSSPAVEQAALPQNAQAVTDSYVAQQLLTATSSDKAPIKAAKHVNAGKKSAPAVSIKHNWASEFEIYTVPDTGQFVRILHSLYYWHARIKQALLCVRVEYHCYINATFDCDRTAVALLNMCVGK
jgi:hypothetical protein